ncbi:hypothetical protein V6N13_004650 [Hibiscus sabdariffa]|uniref:Uncharacterized protein n=1 Tax=Hibiscus sabdariffa TaxID=183260 RepID=A0ABR2RZ40_9ROSI
MAKTPIKFYVVDAFTESAFKGNPAAVCLLEEERDEKWLQAVASEFNISQTCYLTRITDSDSPNPRFRLRWFTPVTEVKLCGHGTLASAHTVFTTGLASPRGGTVKIHLDEQKRRVFLRGNAVTVMEGSVLV